MEHRIILISLVSVAIGCLIGWAVADHALIQRNSSERNALSVTITNLRAKPERYAGKQVKVSGQLDECYGWECSLCPEDMTSRTADPKRCLPLEFSSLMPGTGFGGEAKENVFRFTSVTLIARFNPACWKSPCVDRPAVLYDADVASVGKRRPSSHGLWLGPSTDLAEVTGPFADAIKAKAHDAGFPQNPPIKVFRVKGDPAAAVVCWTAMDLKQQSWPTTLEGAVFAKSANDHYLCNSVREIGNRWIIQV